MKDYGNSNIPFMSLVIPTIMAIAIQIWAPVEKASLLWELQNVLGILALAAPEAVYCLHFTEADHIEYVERLAFLPERGYMRIQTAWDTAHFPT